MAIRLLIGDVRERLRGLPQASVHCVVTSPPYYGLRDYGVDGQVGRELTPGAYVAVMVGIFREVWRVLRDDGVLFLNLGDSYANDGKWGGATGGKHAAALHGGDTGVGRGRHVTGLKPKDLIGIPWAVAFALRDDGWYLRADNIWAKGMSGQRDYLAAVGEAALAVTGDAQVARRIVERLDLEPGSTMPESVRNRTTKAHEYVFMLTKSVRYSYDSEAVAEPGAGTSAPRRVTGRGLGKESGKYGAGRQAQQSGRIGDGGRRNLRSVWAINPRPYKGAHFATFPPELARVCIEAGTSAGGCCAACGTPLRRVIEKGAPLEAQRAACGADTAGGYGGTAQKDYGAAQAQDASATKARILAGMVQRRTTGWRRTCSCDTTAPSGPCIVLDPFCGSGTVLEVADGLGRDAIGIDINGSARELLRDRLERTAGPLFAPGLMAEEDLR